MAMRSKSTPSVAGKSSKVLNREKELVLHNDEVNSFDFVIQTLIDVCDHEPEQAEQCSIITHYMGRCTVKTGPQRRLKTLCAALCERGLQATVE